MSRLVAAPPCARCGRMFVEGIGELCNACLRRERGNPRGSKRRVLLCDCGRMAVTVVWINVGEEGIYLERMALCEECLAEEEA